MERQIVTQLSTEAALCYDAIVSEASKKLMDDPHCKDIFSANNRDVALDFLKWRKKCYVMDEYCSRVDRAIEDSTSLQPLTEIAEVLGNAMVLSMTRRSLELVY